MMGRSAWAWVACSCRSVEVEETNNWLGKK
jgi:hypothetical protein